MESESIYYDVIGPRLASPAGIILLIGVLIFAMFKMKFYILQIETIIVTAAAVLIQIFQSGPVNFPIAGVTALLISIAFSFSILILLDINEKTGFYVTNDPTASKPKYRDAEYRLRFLTGICTLSLTGMALFIVYGIFSSAVLLPSMITCVGVILSLGVHIKSITQKSASRQR